MSWVLGELLEQGIVAKLADDIYCGANNPEDLLANWSKVLEAIGKNSLRLSATKSIISPKSATFLSWVWSEGTLHASSHRIAALQSHLLLLLKVCAHLLEHAKFSVVF